MNPGARMSVRIGTTGSATMSGKHRRAADRLLMRIDEIDLTRKAAAGVDAPCWRISMAER